MSLSPFEHGLDLERAKTFPDCSACRKKSDNAQLVRSPEGAPFFLCGTHFDEYIASGENVAPFVKRLREGKYKPCWDSEPLS